jgi:hypothetical protein
MSRRQNISTSLQLIADLVEQADLYLSESALPQRKGLQIHRRDLMSRIDRRVREKMAPLARNVLRARRERKARSRYQTLKCVQAPLKNFSGLR